MGRAEEKVLHPVQARGWYGEVVRRRRSNADTVEVREPSGRSVAMQRLAQGATAFFQISGSAWAQLATAAPVPTGQPACVETLMDGSNLLALRVFLGADCGPS